MSIADRSWWRELLAPYPTQVLIGMARRLGARLPAKATVGDIVDLLVDVHLDGTRVRACFDETLGHHERLALRLAADCGDTGLKGDFLLAELRVSGAKRGPTTIRGLIETGCLLLDARYDPYYRARSVPFSGQGFREWPLIVHPGLVTAVSSVQLADETSTWDSCQQPVDAVRLEHVTQPEVVLDLLAEVGHIIGRSRRLFNRSGSYSQKLRNILADSRFETANTLDFYAWLQVALSLRLVVDDAETGNYRCLTGHYRLRTDPLASLARLPMAVLDLDPLSAGLERWESLGGSDYSSVAYLAADLGKPLFAACLDLIEQATRRFLAPGQWFFDAELQPALAARCRSWAMEISANQYWSSIHQAPDRLREAVAPLTRQFLDVAGHLALVERGTIGEERLARLTPLGRALLRGWRQPAKEPASRVAAGLAAGLEAPARWSPDGTLVATSAGDAKLVGLALGTLAKPVATGAPADGFRFQIDEDTIAQTLAAGASAESLALRLGDSCLVPDTRPPRALLKSLRKQSTSLRPIRMVTDVLVVTVPGLTADERERLRLDGFWLVDDIVLLPASRRAALERLLHADAWQSVDYELPVQATCKLTAHGVLRLPKEQDDDLRLRTVLADWGGVEAQGKMLQLGVAALGGSEALSPQSQKRLVNEALGRLEEHVVGDVPAAVRTLLHGEAGLIDAPTVAEALVLTFSNAVAQGLSSGHALGSQVERLSKDRFLVPRDALPDVEERLSRMGIPFPAEHSSLRERLRLQAAVGRLQDAVASLEDEQPPAISRADRPDGVDETPRQKQRQK